MSAIAAVAYTEVRAEPFETFHLGAYVEILTLAFLSLHSGGDLVDWYGVFLIDAYHLVLEGGERRRRT